MKKILSLIIATAMVLTSFPLTSYALEMNDVMSEYNELTSMYDSGRRFIESVVLTEDSNEVAVDEKQTLCKEEVTNVDGTVMVPVDALCDHINATYIPSDEYSSYSRIEFEESVVWFSETSGAIDTCVNSEDNITVLDEIPYKEGDTVMVPLESFADALNYEVKESDEDGTHYLLTQPYQTARLLVSTSKKSIDTQGAVASVRDEENDITILQYNTVEQAKAAAENISDIKGVTNVEPDGIMSATMFANQNRGCEELDTTAGHRDDAASECIHVDDMLEPLKKCNLNDVIVGVIDSGVCSTHEALKDRTVCADVDFSSDAQETSEDNNGHGTHVTGIILDNTLDNVNVLAVKALSGAGKGTDYQVYCAMMYAVEQGAKVLNLSLGRYGKSDLMTETVLDLWQRNISVVVAAGNEHWFAREFTPAGIPECITVAACDNDTATNITGSFSNGDYPTDCCAPGLNVYSTWIYDADYSGYRECTGTSMSTPFVTASVAMMYSYSDEYSSEYVHERIRSESQPFIPGYSYGYKDWRIGALDCRSLIEFNRTAMPSVSVAPDYLTEACYVIIDCADENARIYYTTDGSRASNENGALYTEPIYIDKTKRLHIIAYCDGKEQSYQEYYDYVVVITPDESRFTIDDSGIITSFDYEINGEDKYMRVPDTINGKTVYGIGNRAFENNDDIETVFLPETCYLIGDYAFYDCDSLRKFNAKGVTQVGKYAFYNAAAGSGSSSHDMQLGELEKIGEYSFYYTQGYKTLISSKLTEIPESAFEHSLLNYVYAPNVTSIGKKAFCCANYLDGKLEFPKVEKIGEYAFQYCSVDYIDLPSVKNGSDLGEGVFNGCGLYSIDLPNLEGELPYKTFFESPVRTVNLPKVTSVGRLAFTECKNLKELVMESVVEFKSSLSSMITVPGVGSSYGNIEKISMPNCEYFTGIIQSYYLRAVDLPKCKTLNSIYSASLKYLYLPSLENTTHYEYSFKCPNLVYAYLPKFRDIGTRDDNKNTSIFLDCFNLESIDLPSLHFDRSVAGGYRKIIFAVTNSEDKANCKIKTINAPYYSDKMILSTGGLSFDILEDLPSTQSGGDLSVDVTGYNITYQWYYSKDNTEFEPVSGAVNAQITPSNLGYYYVEVTTNNHTQTQTKSSTVCKYTADSVTNLVKELTMTAQSEFTVSANNYTYSAQKNNGVYTLTAYIPQGCVVSVNYDNDDFEAWVNAQNRTVSTKASYDFRIAEDTVLNCVSRSAGTVSFYNVNGDLIQSKKYTAFYENYFPKAPTMYGHTFTGWDKTAEEIDAAVKAGQSIKVTAQYQKNITYYDLILNGGEVVETTSDDYNGEMSFREFSTVTVKASYDVPIFKYWVDANGNIVSYRKEYKFYMSQDLELTAVYGDMAATKQPIVRLTNAYVNYDTMQLVFISERDIPDNYKVLEQGIIMSNDQYIYDGVGELTLDYTGNMLKGVSLSTLNSGTYTVCKKIKKNWELWVAVAYVTYQLPSGKVVTIYSNQNRAEYYKE